MNSLIAFNASCNWSTISLSSSISFLWDSTGFKHPLKFLIESSKCAFGSDCSLGRDCVDGLQELVGADERIGGGGGGGIEEFIDGGGGGIDEWSGGGGGGIDECGGVGGGTEGRVETGTGRCVFEEDVGVGGTGREDEMFGLDGCIVCRNVFSLNVWLNFW